jgi:hypothetical protein
MRVLCVHGIGKQLDGEQTLLSQWRPALQDGLTRADVTGLLADTEVGMADSRAVYGVRSGRLPRPRRRNGHQGIRLWC